MRSGEDCRDDVLSQMLDPLRCGVDRFTARRAACPHETIALIHCRPGMEPDLEAQAAQLSSIFWFEIASGQNVLEEMLRPLLFAHHLQVASAARSFSVIGSPVYAPLVPIERLLDAQLQLVAHDSVSAERMAVVNGTGAMVENVPSNEEPKNQ
jgi:hypothetical protein